MEDLFAGSIPSQLSAAPAEKEFTVSEISFEIKKENDSFDVIEDMLCISSNKA